MADNLAVQKAESAWADQAAKVSRDAENLHGGGGGGNDGGMDSRRIDALEKRFDKFESKFDALHKDVVDLRVQTATLTEKVAHLPGKGFIVTATISALAFFSALVLFGQKILAFLG